MNCSSSIPYGTRETMGRSQAYDWLGRWEDLDCPGKHSKRYSADFAYGYPRPWNAVPDAVPFQMHGVSRAIPVEGTVKDSGPSWERSPQARFWLEKEKTGLWERIVRWLKSPVGGTTAGRENGCPQ